MLFFHAARSQDFSGVEKLLGEHKNLFAGKVSVMIVKDTILYQKSVGEDFTANTQVPIGAAGPWLTAALAMYYVEQGKISLDDPVAKYLPIYAKYAKRYLTIRHCLANTTGLSYEKGGTERFLQRIKAETLEDLVNSYASSREIINNPGEVFNYNPIGTNIAGRVLEVVGKKGFDRLLLEKIMRPLGMKRSTFTTETSVNPFFGGVSTVSDFSKFLSMLMHKGEGNGKRILSEESVAEIFRIQTGNAKLIYAPGQVAGYSYGLGCWIQPGATEVYISPGYTGAWPYLNIRKKFALMIYGEPKDKRDRDEKLNNAYREIAELVEGMM